MTRSGECKVVSGSTVEGLDYRDDVTTYIVNNAVETSPDYLITRRISVKAGTEQVVVVSDVRSRKRAEIRKINEEVERVFG